MSDGQYSYNRTQNSTVSYNAFWNRGRHSVTYGGDMRLYRFNVLAQQDARERNRPVNAGKYWSREEDAEVCAKVRKGIDFHEIARSHHPSVGSIVARLWPR